ncbi:L-ribulose-5-phosphate 3-epimerase [Enterococcus sp. LJL98]
MLTLGIYEKALPKNSSWFDKLKMAQALGFHYIEMSIDETDERLARLDWSDETLSEVQQAIIETGVNIYSMCLSGHRRYPFGSKDRIKREQALQIMEKAVNLASKLGIRNIQLAGYDVYYEDKSILSREYFIENLTKAVQLAAAKQVMLSIEIMDDPFMNSISKFMKIKREIPSPWLQCYPDIGNLSAWPENDVGDELSRGIEAITAVHLKDTLSVKDGFPGKFKNVPFGRGDVDFLGCLKTLKRLNYNGSFLIEMWSETDEDPARQIQEAKDFLLPILKEAGYHVGTSN